MFIIIIAKKHIFTITNGQRVKIYSMIGTLFPRISQVTKL